jgi:hypothetical protein
MNCWLTHRSESAKGNWDKRNALLLEHVANLAHDLVDAFGRWDREAVGKRRRLLGNALLVDLVPNRKNAPLAGRELLRHKTIEFALRPMLGEE